MIGLNNRENIIVSSGDHAFLPDGTTVWTLVNGHAVLNVPAGTLFAMDVKTGLSVDHTNIASIKNPIRIGVSLGDTVRWLSGEEFFPKNVESLSAMHAICGTPEVVDMYWNCTDCDTTYTALLTVRDNDTMSYSSAPTDAEQYEVSAKPDCTSCNDCNPEAVCSEVQTALIAAFETALDELDIKAYVTKIYPESEIYCFKHSGETCNSSCTEFADITSVTVGEGEEAATVPITIAASAASMAELLTALNLFKEQLEASADFEGTVFITSGFGEQCCVQVHINSELPVVLNYGDASTYTACQTPANAHEDMCGIRIIAAPVTQDSACIISKPLAYYFRELNLYPAFGFQDAVVVKVYSMGLPQNFGNFVQYEEYKQDSGGQGRRYRKTNTRLADGFGVNPDSRSRISNAITFADPALSYVSIHIEHNYPHQNHATDVFDPPSITSSIYIPECDSTTIASFLLFLDEIATLADLPTIDVTSGTHPNYVGINL